MAEQARGTGRCCNVDLSSMQLSVVNKETTSLCSYAGNLAGSGAVMILCDSACIDQAVLLAEKTEVIELASNAEFQSAFIENLRFPEA